MRYGIEQDWGRDKPKPVMIFDNHGNRRLAAFDTIDAAEECARALAYAITSSAYQGWTIVDLTIPA